MSYVIPSYRYGSLPPDTIRLLRLLPHQDRNAPIHCQLFDYSLQESDTRTHPYDALSYVWGGSDKPQSISISQHPVVVTRNLHEALSRLRYRSIERIIWIDAVCINQENDREKEQQIQLMAKIFAQANCVVVWLGEATDNSSLALETIRSAGDKRSIYSPSDQSIQPILTLLRRPWFRRIWVRKQTLSYF